MPNPHESPAVARGGATGGGGGFDSVSCASPLPPRGGGSSPAAQRHGRVLRAALSERDVRFAEHKRNASEPAELQRSALGTRASICGDASPSSSATGLPLDAAELQSPFASCPRQSGDQEVRGRSYRPTEAGEMTAATNGRLVHLGSDSSVVGCRSTAESVAAAAIGGATAADLARRDSVGNRLGPNEQPTDGESPPLIAMSRPGGEVAAVAGSSAIGVAGGSAYMLPQPATTTTAAVQQDRGRWSRLIPSYRQRSDEFRRQFKTLPEEERLLVDYSCALQKDFLIHGRLYVSQNWICFYSNIFGWESSILVPLREITAVNKCRTAKVIPNAIQITTTKDRYLFSSFVARDQTYLVIFRAWICALSDNPIDGPDLWSLVRWLYGLPTAEQDHIPDDLLLAAERPAEESRPSLEQGACGAVAPSESPENAYSSGQADMTADESELALPVSQKRSAIDQEVLDGNLDRDEDDSGSLHSRTGSSSSSCSSNSTNEDDDLEAKDGPGMIAECPAVSHEHKGVQILDSTFDMPASQLFELLFTERPFYSDFLTKRGTTDLALSTWPHAVDEAGKKKRTITYTLAINASFGPKRSPATEVQVLLPETSPGSFYAVDCECLNSPTLPYGENFYVLNKYCISRRSGTSCRLIVHSEIVYVKAVFSIVRGIIQRNVAAGIKGYFQHLDEALRAISSLRDTGSLPAVRRQAPAGGDAEPASVSAPVAELPAAVGDEKRSVRPSNLFECRREPEASGVLQQHGKSTPETDAKHLGHRNGVATECSHRRKCILSAALCLLLVCNVLMCLYIWRLDVHSLDLHCSGREDVSFVQDNVIRALLEQHKRSRDEEIEHWRGLLESSSVMVNQLKRDIEELRRLVPMKDKVSNYLPDDPVASTKS